MSGLLTFINRRVIERRAPGAIIVGRIAHVLKILRHTYLTEIISSLLRLERQQKDFFLS